jgi:hypothetical protein
MEESAHFRARLLVCAPAWRSQQNGGSSLWIGEAAWLIPSRDVTVHRIGTEDGPGRAGLTHGTSDVAVVVAVLDPTCRSARLTIRAAGGPSCPDRGLARVPIVN